MTVKYFITGIIVFLAYLPLSNAVPLKSELALRLDAGRGFPVYVEFPSGTDVDVVLRRGQWIKITDQRGVGGWCLLNELKQAGGAEKLQLWRWRESGYADRAWLGAELNYSQDITEQGYAINFASHHKQIPVSADFEQVISGPAAWTAAYLWAGMQWSVVERWQLEANLGSGLGYGNSSNQVLSKVGQEKYSLLLAAKTSIYYRINPLVRTGFNARIATDQKLAKSHSVISWTWQVKI